jgi:hypothetical protein
MVLLFALISLAGDGRIHECRLSIGTIQFCTATGYQGTVPLETEGRVRTCKVDAGKAVYCGHPYTGTIVLDREGKYRECQARGGYVISCKGTGFTGTAVVSD